jgi:DUF971 family protein
MMNPGSATGEQRAMSIPDDAIPTGLSLAGPNQLVIQWGDTGGRAYDVGELRRSCPCATCNTRRAHAPAGQDPWAKLPPVTIQSMSPVGNYAYKIVFSDEHATGIFPLSLLRVLGGPCQGP